MQFFHSFHSCKILQERIDMHSLREIYSTIAIVCCQCIRVKYRFFLHQVEFFKRLEINELNRKSRYLNEDIVKFALSALCRLLIEVVSLVRHSILHGKVCARVSPERQYSYSGNSSADRCFNNNNKFKIHGKFNSSDEKYEHTLSCDL